MAAKKLKSREARDRKISPVNHNVSGIFSTTGNASLQIEYETFNCNAN